MTRNTTLRRAALAPLAANSSRRHLVCSRSLSGQRNWVNIMRFRLLPVILLLVLSFARNTQGQPIDQLYEAAKKEAALSLNGGGPAGLYEPCVREFERRFPGIKVNLSADFSNILAPIILPRSA